MRRNLGTTLIIVSTSWIALIFLLLTLSAVLQGLFFETTLIDSCKMGNSQETIDVYYHATILQGSYTVIYQPHPFAQTRMIVASRDYPEIVGVECSDNSVLIYYSDPHGPYGDKYTDELSRAQFLETYVYYEDGEKSIQAYTYQPLFQQLLCNPFLWILFFVLLIIGGLHLRRPK